MARRQATPCHHWGCRELTHDYYCLEHKRKATRLEVAGRRERTRIYDGKQWRNLRLMHLRRQPLCVMCGEAGGTVDHIIPIEQDGEMWNVSNLQTLCFDCHQLKRAKEAQMKKRNEKYNQSCRVTVVTGPPGAGKTSYVKERAIEGDLILDIDRLFVAFTGLPKYEKPNAILPFVLNAYESVIAQLTNGTGDVRHAWIISGAPEREKRNRLKWTLNAKVVVLDEREENCIERIKNDPSRNGKVREWTELIRQWWIKYEPEEEVNYG